MKKTIVGLVAYAVFLLSGCAAGIRFGHPGGSPGAPTSPIITTSSAGGSQSLQSSSMTAIIRLAPVALTHRTSGNSLLVSDPYLESAIENFFGNF